MNMTESMEKLIAKEVTEACQTLGIDNAGIETRAYNAICRSISWHGLNGIEAFAAIPEKELRKFRGLGHGQCLDIARVIRKKYDHSNERALKARISEIDEEIRKLTEERIDIMKALGILR